MVWQRSKDQKPRAPVSLLIEAPEQKPFGLQAIFKDLCGNSYALLEPDGGDR